MAVNLLALFVLCYFFLLGLLFGASDVSCVLARTLDLFTFLSSQLTCIVYINQWMNVGILLGF